MNMEKAFFAADLGATSGRTMLATLSDKGLDLQEVNRFPNHLLRIGENDYWDIFELYRNILEGLKLVSAQGIRPVSVGIDTWGCDFACLGSDGKLLRLPSAYRDGWTAGAPEKFFKTLPLAELYGRTGIQVMNFNSVFQMDTMRRKGDAAFAAASKLLFMPDALTYLLTGETVCEYSVATTGQIVGAETRRLDPAVLKALGLTEANFGRFVRPGEEIGYLSPGIQRLTGLGPVPVIAVAEHDTASAVAAVPAENEHFAYLSSGTWSLMGIESPAPIINLDTQLLNFTNEGGIEGTIRFLKNITGLWLLERCRPVWRAAGREYSYAEMEAAARAAEDFPSTVDPDDPCFANPADMVEAICSRLRAQGKPVPQTDGELISCIYHSLVSKYVDVMGSLRRFAPFEIRKLHVIGGGSANATLSQWTADATGMPVVCGPMEATAIGNVMVQAKAAGLVKDRWEMRRIIADTCSVKTYSPHNVSI